MWKCPQTGCRLIVLHPIRLTRGVWWCSVCEQLVRDLVLITSCWTGCLHRPGRLSSRLTVAVLTNRRQRREPDWHDGADFMEEPELVSCRPVTLPSNQTNCASKTHPQYEYRNKNIFFVFYTSLYIMWLSDVKSIQSSTRFPTTPHKNDISLNFVIGN